MSENPPVENAEKVETTTPPPSVHGVWFWRMAIFEGSTSVFVAMAGAVMAAGATWDSATINSMEPWQWGLFWLGVTTSGVKTLQAFLSKTVENLNNKSKEDDAL